MEKSAPSVWMPALIGGAVFGFLSGVPFVGALNCVCCSLVIGSGFLAAFLYSKECRKSNVEFRAGAGAKIGVVAGLFHAVVDTITGHVARLFGAGPNMDEAIEQIRSNPQIPSETADTIIGFLEMLGSEGSILFVLLINLVFGLIFATIGGLIGGATFKVEPETPAAPSP